jgi:hypothetical protein
MASKGCVRDVLCLGLCGAEAAIGAYAKRCKAGNWIYCFQAIGEQGGQQRSARTH